MMQMMFHNTTSKSLRTDIDGIFINVRYIREYSVFDVSITFEVRYFGMLLSCNGP